jgi:TPR repeat protein
VAELDVLQLLKDITSGTDVRLDAETLAPLWQVGGIDMQRPLVAALGSNAPIFAASPLTGSHFELAAADAALSARGLAPLKGAECVLREGGPGGRAVLCGNRDVLLGLASTLPVHPEGVAEGATLRVAWRPGKSRAAGLYDLRGAVPRQLDPLLPEGSALDQASGLRLGLSDVAFEVVDRIVDGYEKLGPLTVSLSREQAGKLAWSATVRAEASSMLGRAVAEARPVRVSEAFWELPEDVSGAVLFDGSLLAPLLQVSPRATALLAEARSSTPIVDELGKVAASCVQPGQSIVFATGQPAAAATKPQKTGPPELREFPPPATAPRAGYTLLAVDDKNGACGKALTSLLLSHERLSAVSGQAEAQRHVSQLPVAAPLPKDVKLIQIGSKSDATFWGLTARKGAMWLASSGDLETLKGALTGLFIPAPKRRTGKGRSELAELGNSPGLLLGFMRDALAPLSDGWGKRKARIAMGVERPDDTLPILPFAVSREGSGLRVSGQLQARAVRRLVARLVSDAGAQSELSSLSGEKRAALLNVLDAVCRLGEGNACNWLGVIYGDGRGVPRDTGRAVALLEQGCRQDAGTACANLAFYKKPDKAEELALFQKSCALDSPFGCAWWGVRLLDGDKPEDQPLGFAKLQAGCDGFVGFACARIGSHYREGIGLKQDDTKGADFYERSCMLGSGQGCVALADSFLSGKGRPNDERQAFGLLRKGCKIDKAEGCYALGYAYLNGTGTAKDEAAARAQFEMACEAEHAEACRALAEMAGEP